MFCDTILLANIAGIMAAPYYGFGLALFALLFQASATAADCAPGYAIVSEWKTQEVFLGRLGATPQLCLNLDNPSLNEPRKGYGISYGAANYQCGSLRLYQSNLNTHNIQLITQDGTRAIEFTLADSDRQIYDDKLYSRCTQDGLVCSRTSQISDVYLNSYTNDKLVKYWVSKDFYECAKVSF